MATNILMPALSPTMTEGTLSRWLKKEGENVRAGDVIAEIETDKATMEIEAVDEGVLGKILIADGTEGVKVNEPIAILVDQGEDVPAAAPAPARPSPAPQRALPQSGNGHDAGGLPSSVRPERQRPGARPEGARIFVSPLARRMAQQAGIDLATLKGSGPNGRIVKLDIETALRKEAPSAPQPAAAPITRPSVPISAPHKLVPHSSVRKVIARRLTEAKSTIPHFYVSMDVEIDALIR